MHDFHLADTIYKAIVEESQKNGLKKVIRAEIGLGVIIEHGEEILPENLKFNIKMLAQGGFADGLEIEIGKITGGDWVLKNIEGE